MSIWERVESAGRVLHGSSLLLAGLCTAITPTAQALSCEVPMESRMSTLMNIVETNTRFITGSSQRHWHESN